MEVKKVTELKELDNIIPLIQKLKNSVGNGKYSSMIGYLSWIVLNFPLDNFQIWKAEEDGVAKGYLITQITQRYFIPECCIVDAFMDENNSEIVDAVYSHVVAWAKEKGCNQISINTKREAAFAKKYGFEYLGTTMAKKI
jgi:hypothetical protein